MKLEEIRLFKQTKIDLSTIEIRSFKHNDTIEYEAEESKYLGIVLEGLVDVVSYSLAGTTFIISTLNPGMIFGDVLMFGGKSNQYPGNLISKGNTQIAIIPNNDVKTYLKHDTFFMMNFLSVLSDKVFNLNEKSKLLQQDTIRDKILLFLHQQQKHQNSNIIELNMTKEDLANLLFIQRPSLSRELINMKNDGLIDYDRWTITLK